MTLPKYSQSEQTTPTTYPQAGWQGLFFDSADDGKLKRIDDAGTVVSIEDIGTVGLDQGGTGADLSSGQGVLIQATSGANVSSLGGTGILKLASDVPSIAVVPAFKAKPTSAQTITANVWTKVVLGTEIYDTNNNFTNSRFTVTVAGLYLFECFIDMLDTTANQYALVGLYKNGSRISIQQAVSPIDLNLKPYIFTQDFAEVGDYYEMYIYIASVSKDVHSDTSYFAGVLVPGT
jgi:hypothetical protein